MKLMNPRRRIVMAATSTQDWIESSRHFGPRALRAHQGSRRGVRRFGHGRRRGRSGCGGGGDGAGAEEESSTVDVVLTEAGEKKIQVIKAVRAATGLGSRRQGPRRRSAQAVKEGIEREDAEALLKEIQEAGAAPS